MSSDSTELLDAVSANALDAGDGEVFEVDISGYEGPLHLLLALGRRQKVDLTRVSILELAEQYLDFIQAASDKRIDLAADYLLMAAWLAFLKSKLLLPKPKTAEADDVDGEDMARRLAFRLQRLEAMRDASAQLFQGAILGRDVFCRGAPERSKVVKDIRYHARMIDLMAAFAGIQNRRQLVKPHTIEKQYVLPLEAARISLKKATDEIDDWTAIETIEVDLDGGDGEAPPKSRLASVFSAALELTKEGDVDLRQDALFSPILVRKAQHQAPAGV